MRNRLMKSCDRLEAYLDGRLYAEDARGFEAHLETCEECEREVTAWSRLNRNVADEWADLAERRRPSLYAARALGDRARERRQQVASGLGPRLGWALAGAAAVAVVFMVVVFTRFDLKESSPEQMVASRVWIDAEIIALDSGAAKPRRVSLGESIIVGDNARALADLGLDRLGVGPASRVRVMEIAGRDVSVALDRGLVACDVTPRNGDGRFVVEAGPHKAIVVGTRFAARLGPGDALDVTVDEGTVEVRTGGEWVHRVEAGGRVEIGADGNASLVPISARERRELSWLLGRDEKPAVETEPRAVAASTSTPRPVAPSVKAANLDTWKLWIVEGKLARAERAIEAHLASHPADHRAWAALGHCRRKATEWDRAVGAYLEAARVGPPSSANQHRFRAGTLLQDTLGNHARAAEVFQEYLKHPGAKSLRLDVEIRLARAYMATGRKGAAVEMLKQIVEQHPGTGAAVKAVKLLDER